MRQTKEMRLKRVQHLAHEIMDEMNKSNNLKEAEALYFVIDNLSRAVGDLVDPFGHYSLDYVEEKVKNAHVHLFKSKKYRLKI